MKILKKIKQETLYLLLLKNTILLLIPALIIFGCALMYTIQVPILYRYNTRFVSDYKEMQDWYGRECYNVQRTISDLSYTGIDYYEGDRLKGAFYYAFTGEGCLLVLKETKKPEAFYDNVMVRGKMIKNSPNFDAMMQEYANLTGMNLNDLKAIALPIVISEIDYPVFEKFLLAVVLVLPMVVSGLLILLCNYWIWQPAMTPSCSIFREFGSRRLVYQELRSQFKTGLLDHWGKYYATTDYLVISEWLQTYFVRMDFVQYMACSIIKSKNSKHQKYRLTLSNPQKMFFEYDFRDEEDVQRIVALIQQQNPNVLNYVDQPPEGYEVAAMIHGPEEVVEIYDGTKEYVLPSKRRKAEEQERLQEQLGEAVEGRTEAGEEPLDPTQNLVSETADQSLEEEIAEMEQLGISPEASQSEEIVKEAN